MKIFEGHCLSIGRWAFFLWEYAYLKGCYFIVFCNNHDRNGIVMFVYYADAVVRTDGRGD